MTSVEVVSVAVYPWRPVPRWAPRQMRWIFFLSVLHVFINAFRRHRRHRHHRRRLTALPPPTTTTSNSAGCKTHREPSNGLVYLICLSVFDQYRWCKCAAELSHGILFYMLDIREFQWICMIRRAEEPEPEVHRMTRRIRWMNTSSLTFARPFHIQWVAFTQLYRVTCVDSCIFNWTDHIGYVW